MQKEQIKKSITLLLIIVLILIGYLLLIQNKGENTSNNLSDIQHIVYDHDKKELLGIFKNNESKKLIDNINFSADDTFLNLQSKFILLIHYAKGKEGGLVESFVYKINKDGISLDYSIKDQSIFYYIDAKSYGYTQNNYSYSRYNGQDNKIYSISGVPYYLGNPTVLNTTYALNSSGSGVEQFDNKTGEHIANTGFSGFSIILNYFTFTSNNQIYSYFDQQHNNSVISIYPALVTDTSIPEPKRNSSKAIKDVVIPETATLLSSRNNNLLYFSAVKDIGKYDNFVLDLSNYKVTEINDFTASEELIY